MYSKDGKFTGNAAIFATRQRALSAITSTDLYCIEARFTGKSTVDADKITISGHLYMRPMKLDVPEFERERPSIAALARFLGMYEEDPPPNWGAQEDLYASVTQCSDCPGGTIQTDRTGSTHRPPGHIMVAAKYLKRPVVYAWGTMIYRNGGYEGLFPKATWIMPYPTKLPSCRDGVHCLTVYGALLNAELKEDGVNTGPLGTFIDLAAGWYAARR